MKYEERIEGYTGSDVVKRMLELQQLDCVPRTGFRQHRLLNAESVSEHVFHTVFLVWLLSGHVAGINRMKAMEIALVHDVGELKIGDLSLDACRYISRKVKHAAELAASKDFFESVRPRGGALVEEFLEGVSIEARFVSACDKLQLLVKCLHYEMSGARGLEEFWVNVGPALASSEFKAIREAYVELGRVKARILEGR